MRTIYGAKSMGRFGTTIAASDIDGDRVPGDIHLFILGNYKAAILSNIIIILVCR